MAAGQPAGFTVDGPRGPARVAQPGAVWLAKATGNPVLPFHLEAEPPLDARAAGTARRFRSRSATVAIAMGEPFDVPPDADDAGARSAAQAGRCEQRLRRRSSPRAHRDLLDRPDR